MHLVLRYSDLAQAMTRGVVPGPGLHRVARHFDPLNNLLKLLVGGRNVLKVEHIVFRFELHRASVSSSVEAQKNEEIK